MITAEELRQLRDHLAMLRDDFEIITARVTAMAADAAQEEAGKIVYTEGDATAPQTDATQESGGTPAEIVTVPADFEAHNGPGATKETGCSCGTCGPEWERKG